jgi:hypothetical protein
VESIFNLETEAFPVLHNMTSRGIRFDRPKCERLIEQLIARERELHAELRKICGNSVDIWAAASIAAAEVPVPAARSKTNCPGSGLKARTVSLRQ